MPNISSSLVGDNLNYKNNETINYDNVITEQQQKIKTPRKYYRKKSLTSETLPIQFDDAKLLTDSLNQITYGQGPNKNVFDYRNSTSLNNTLYTLGDHSEEFSNRISIKSNTRQPTFIPNEQHHVSASSLIPSNGEHTKIKPLYTSPSSLSCYFF